MDMYKKPLIEALELDIEAPILTGSDEPEEGAEVGGGTSTGWD